MQRHWWLLAAFGIVGIAFLAGQSLCRSCSSVNAQIVSAQIVSLMAVVVDQLDIDYKAYLDFIRFIAINNDKFVEDGPVVMPVHGS